MHATFDRQIFVLQRRGGITRYFVELLREFDALPELGIEPVLPFRRVSSDATAELSRYGLRDVNSRVTRKLLLAAASRRSSAVPTDGVMHHTFYHPAYLDLAPGLAKVVTVYDMIPERFPTSAAAHDHLAKKDYIARADLILTISEATKRDLLDLYDVGSTPVVVTPLGVDPGFAAGGPDPGIGSDYVLFVGRRESYKDFPVLLRALRGLPADIRLLAVGGGPLTIAEQGLITELGLTDRVVRQDLDDTRLAGAYAHARAFIMPSRYEGFGLPVLEAMAAGTPVIAARAASLPEVGAAAATYFEPGEHEDLAEVLRQLLADPGKARHMRALGRERATQFTWAQTARLTASAYRMVV